jgi:hypothetical protein
MFKGCGYGGLKTRQVLAMKPADALGLAQESPRFQVRVGAFVGAAELGVRGVGEFVPDRDSVG